MATDKQQETKDTLTSIFDFIFAETQKPVDKRRPIKPTNIDGTSEMVDAVASVLEKPGLYVSDQMANDLEEALNIQFAEIYLGKASPQGKTKLGTKDLISILKDPNDFFDKAYKKSNPKFNMAEWSGRTFRGINAQNWAKKRGIKDKETLWAINRAAASFDNPSDRLDLVRDGQKMIRKQVAMVAVREVCKENGIPGAASAIAKYIDKAGNISGASDLDYILRHNAQITDPDLIDAIKRKFNSQSGKIAGIDDKLIKGYKGSPVQGKDENIDIYRSILSGYHAERGQIYRLGGTSDDQKNAEDQEKIAILMTDWRIFDKRNKEVLKQSKNDLKNVRDKIKQLQKSGIHTPADRAILASLQNDEKKLKADINLLNSGRGLDNYFKYKGMWNTMNSIYLKGNLAGSILDGTFFSDDNKILNPVETSYKGTMSYKGGSTIFFNIANKDKLFREEKGTGKYKVKSGNFYNDTMTYVSYLTPQKIFQVNGEFFAFRTYKNRTRMFKKMLKLSNNQDELTKDLISMGFFNSDGTLNFSLFNKTDNDYQELQTAMAKLKHLIENDKQLKKYFKDSDKVMKMFKQYERMDKLLKGATSVFSAGYRTREWIKDKINDATLKKLRQGIYDKWLKKFAEDKIMGPAVKQWLAGAGVQALFRGVVEKALIKIGVKKLGKAVFNVIAGAATGGLSTLAFMGFKVLAQVCVIALIGIVFLIGSGTSLANTLTTRYSRVSHVTPGEVEHCEGFIPENLVNPDGSGGILKPAPSNSTCPLGESSIHCTQGYTLGEISTHTNMVRNNPNRKPIDLRYSSFIYAPQYCDTSTCTATYKGKVSCIDGSYAGDQVDFSDSFGNYIMLVHTYPVGVGTPSPGQSWTVTGGEAFAQVQTNIDASKTICWTGAHLHIEVTQDGSYVDPLEFLQSYGCSVPDEVQCDND